MCLTKTGEVIAWVEVTSPVGTWLDIRVSMSSVPANCNCLYNGARVQVVATYKDKCPYTDKIDLINFDKLNENLRNVMKTDGYLLQHDIRDVKYDDKKVGIREWAENKFGYTLKHCDESNQSVYYDDNKVIKYKYLELSWINIQKDRGRKRNTVTCNCGKVMLPSVYSEHKNVCKIYDANKVVCPNCMHRVRNLLKHKSVCYKVKCTKCSMYVYRNNLPKHNQIHEEIKCRKCNIYITRADIKKHNQICDKTCKCRTCKIYFTKAEIKNHQIKCGGCKFCGEHFIESVEEHFIVCPDYKRNCKYCNEPYIIGKFKKHSLVCSKKDTFVWCPICGDLIYKKNLEKHNIKCKVKVICDYCGELVYKKNLKKHNQIHEEIKCRKCNIYINKADIKKHIQIHKEIKCRKCNIYIIKADIEKHNQICDKKVNKCPKCLVYVAREDIKKHILICNEFQEVS